MRTGLESAKKYCDEIGEGGLAAQYSNPGKCDVGDDEERNGLRELFGEPVCAVVDAEPARLKLAKKLDWARG